MTSKRERFENKFYEMIRLHRDNVSEIEIAGRYKGRKAFVKMYQEFKFIYMAIDHVRKNWLKDKEKTRLIETFDYNKQLDLSYNLFFFGVDPEPIKADEVHVHDGIDSGFYTECLKRIRKIREKKFPLNSSTSENENGYKKLNIVPDDKNSYSQEFNYYPFNGHVSKLGHYFRHLYQTIKLVATDPTLEPNKWDQESYKARYDYVKTLRVQLSNHEQAMVYFNSFFKKGEIWWQEREEFKFYNDKGYRLSYFLDYGMIKNLPFNLTRHIGEHPEKVFENMLLQRGYSKGTKELEEKLENLLEWLEDS